MWVPYASKTLIRDRAYTASMPALQIPHSDTMPRKKIPNQKHISDKRRWAAMPESVRRRHCFPHFRWKHVRCNFCGFEDIVLVRKRGPQCPECNAITSRPSIQGLIPGSYKRMEILGWWVEEGGKVQ